MNDTFLKMQIKATNGLRKSLKKSAEAVLVLKEAKETGHMPESKEEMNEMINRQVTGIRNDDK